MHLRRSPLDALANPGAIALVGANPDPATVGGGLARNLLDGGYTGPFFFINPHHREIGGRPCYASLADLPDRVDLALIATPADTVPDLIDRCGAKRVKAAIIYGAGFAETGEAGAAAEADLLTRARRWGIRILGPRALGFLRPHLGLNATPFRRRFPAGNLALVSQSGAVCTAVLDWVFGDDFALSALFSPGNGSDLDLPEILDFLAADPRTESILLYLEGVRDSRRFLSALRAAARVKPVVVVKSGRTPASAAVAQAHCQAAEGDDAAFDAALRRAGALRVRSIGDLFSAARALTSSRKPAGNRLAVVSNGGGPAVMAADAAADWGIRLPPLAAATVAALRAELPPAWCQTNPVDVLINAEPRRFAAAVAACLADSETDGTLAIFSPSTFVDPTLLAEALASLCRPGGKPLLVCCQGEASVREARHLLAEAGIPVFRTPESAVTAFAFMVDFVRNQRLLLETPPALSGYRPPDVAAAQSAIAAALADGRGELLPAEAARVLAAFHLPLAGEAVDALRVLRLAIRRDACFGPVIVVGEGGPLPREPAAVLLPPLNDRLIGDLCRDPAIVGLLVTAPGKPPLAGDALRQWLLRVSELACELPAIAALEIDLPLIGGQVPAASRAAIAIRPAAPNTARYPHMAICPYPLAMETHCRTKSGDDYLIRPIRPEDAVAFQRFVRRLSDRSRHYRFFGALRELPLQQLVRGTQIDYDREMVLVAVRQGREGEEVVAEANYGVLVGEPTCEFAVVVADELAGQGIGSRIMGRLMDAARERGLTRMVGEVLSENEPMLGLMDALGFIVTHTDDPDILELGKRL